MKKLKYTVRLQWSSEMEHGFREIYFSNLDDAIAEYNRMVNEQIHDLWARAFDANGKLNEKYISEEHTPEVESATFYIAEKANSGNHTIVTLSKTQ